MGKVRLAPVVVELQGEVFGRYVRSSPMDTFPPNKLTELIDGRYPNSPAADSALSYNPMHIHVGKFPTSIDDYFSFVVHFIPADRVLFDSQLFWIMFNPSRGPEHFPIDEYRGIFFVLFEPCPDRGFVDRA